ncbi:hypothetical protein B0F90DRAFT_1810010 [Multifurca ochricompacta]|uniref:Protein BIG1 n=1 Tax=Multifurca ochricompacta TaxID=376703 RepID=A0AAD4M5J5_9AGAM|nr:hypothetical protein B0F90DRAFT_1810010 [Multifurca ochricompacta]
MLYSTNLPLVLVASFTTVLAFSNTSPFVAWSSVSTSPLRQLRPVSSTPHSSEVFGKFLSEIDLCEYDAVIVVDQPGLHASDLRTLSPSSYIAMRLHDSPSSLQLPYVRSTPDATNPIQDLASKVAQRCGSQRLSFPIGTVPDTLDLESKHVLSLTMPALVESAGARKRSVAEHEARLAGELERIERAFPRHLVIFSGSRRQDDTVPKPAPSGGILARYQLLTPALITSLLLALFVLVPIVLFGISALAKFNHLCASSRQRASMRREKEPIGERVT